MLIQTFARPEAIAAGHAEYAASITAEILKFYEDYFQINYQQKTLGKTLYDWNNALNDGRKYMSLLQSKKVSFLSVMNMTIFWKVSRLAN